MAQPSKATADLWIANTVSDLVQGDVREHLPLERIPLQGDVLGLGTTTSLGDTLPFPSSLPLAQKAVCAPERMRTCLTMYQMTGREPGESAHNTARGRDICVREAEAPSTSAV
jgi:hypothetical protein